MPGMRYAPGEEIRRHTVAVAHLPHQPLGLRVHLHSFDRSGQDQRTFFTGPDDGTVTKPD